MPPGLPKRAQEEWDRVVPLLDKMGVLSELDRVALADYCLCVARVAQIEASIDEKGVMIKGRNRGGGIVKNPLFTTVRQYRAALQRWCDLFGFAPGPRGRMDFPPPDDDLESLREMLSRPRATRIQPPIL